LNCLIFSEFGCLAELAQDGASIDAGLRIKVDKSVDR
jgi:hypothetical protein